jgi:phosphopentomutase
MNLPRPQIWETTHTRKKQPFLINHLSLFDSILSGLSASNLIGVARFFSVQNTKAGKNIPKTI